jgi:hypothetical protein
MTWMICGTPILENNPICVISCTVLADSARNWVPHLQFERGAFRDRIFEGVNRG